MDLMTPDPREEKLANWTQRTLRQLRMRLAEAERAAEEARLSTKPDTTDTVVCRFSRHDIGLEQGARIRFWPEGRSRDYVDAYVHGGALRIQGQAPITLAPSASNSVYISVREPYTGGPSGSKLSV